MKTIGSFPKATGMNLATKLACLALAGALLSASGCKQREKPEDTGTATTTEKNGPGNATNVTPANSEKIYVRAKLSDDYTTFTHEYSSFTAPCSIEKGVSEDKLCFIESEELDLWFWGLEVEFNVPKETCPYVKFIAPYYWNLPAGYGPAVVSYETSAAGVLTDNANSNNGDPVCPYDYSAFDGPNCCLGKYSKTVGTWDTVAGVMKYTTTTGNDWGGDAALCLGGVGMDINPLTDKGWPVWTISNSWKGGYTKAMTVTKPSKKPYGSNIRVANYFRLDDYFNASATIPNTFLPINTPTAAGIFGPYSAFEGAPGSTIKRKVQPYFEFICMDRNEDVISRIRMMIRSWDTAGYMDLSRAYAYYDANQPNPGNQSATFPAYGTDYGVAYHDMKTHHDIHAYPYAAPAAWTPDGTLGNAFPPGYPFLFE